MNRIKTAVISIAATLAVLPLSASSEDAGKRSEAPAIKLIHVAIYQDTGTPDLSAQVVDNALKISPSFVTKRVDADDIRNGDVRRVHHRLHRDGQFRRRRR